MSINGEIGPKLTPDTPEAAVKHGYTPTRRSSATSAFKGQYGGPGEPVRRKNLRLGSEAAERGGARTNTCVEVALPGFDTVERYVGRVNPRLSIQETADYLGICTRTVRRYIAEGRLRAVTSRGVV